MTDPASWWLKVERAEQHLEYIKAVIRATIRDENLTTVRVDKQHQGGEWVYSLRLGVEPPSMLELTIGDFLFNMASALDHITTANAGGVGRNHTNFPIFSVDVREGAPNEAEVDPRWRKRWKETSNAVVPAVFAVIEKSQPFMYAVNGTALPKEHPLAILNGLHNADKHERLNLLAWGLSGIVATVDGRPIHDLIRPGTMIKDGAAFYAHPDEVDVHIAGQVRVAISGGRVTDNFKIPEALDHIVHTVTGVLRQIEAVM